MFSPLILLSFFSLFFCSLIVPIRAETCKPLPLVGGEGSTVTKTVSQPTIPTRFGNITNSNWNTDWAVPGGESFKRYVVTVTSKDDNSFDIRMYLKYSDQTADEFFNEEGYTVNPDQPLKVSANPRKSTQPYQVNLFVNGVASFGKTYTATVMGCF
ncbi:hypothetical protein [Cyanobacterium aponinum]|uniref:Uncharacterized protein n=1 Tax=Cyanobacterium aponinum (strain PCC 10605) TaxID=755178 RepID=K9Z5K7_CYAAP|nr:hypothetical protein [Cyanobacterium aponinum]AFZ54471.1 hypothetical protein Cyan10605_2389 [Cyanobacterium aponinum PCC 10605]